MNTEELCAYLKSQGVEDVDIQTIKTSPYEGQMILSMMKSNPEKIATIGLSTTCIRKLKAWIEYAEYRSAKEAKAKQKKVHESSNTSRTTTGHIVYHAPQETQEVVIRLGYGSSDED